MMNQNNKVRCLIVDDDEMCRSILEDLIAEISFLELVDSCSNPVEAFNILQSDHIDLVFLDIEMPRLTGLELMENLSRVPEVILVSSHQGYALEAYEYDVVDYLIKPVESNKFLRAVSKAANIVTHKRRRVKEGKKVFIKSDSKLVQIDTKEILWVEAFGNYVTIRTPEKKYTVNMTMKQVEARLPDFDFIRVHRSTIVRKDKIREIKDDHLVIANSAIPIGGVYKDGLMSSINYL